MTSIVAVRTLHSSSIFEEFAAKRATHDVVELLLHKLVTILLNDLFFTLANSTFPAKTYVECLLVMRVFGFSCISI